MSLSDPSLFINRELSLLEFNKRVLAQAQDARMPLLERVRFLAIASSNLDEFFEIRVAGLQQQVAFDLSASGSDQLTPHEALARISTEAHALVDEQYRTLNDEILPALEKEDIRVLARHTWSAPVTRWVQGYFAAQVQPVLTPIGIDPAHPFPNVLNKSLNFILSVHGDDAFGRTSGFAVVQVPRSLPRLIRIPEKVTGSRHHFVLLSSVVHAHIASIFPGMSVSECHQFRITRNSDLWVDEEEVENLLLALQGELPSRNYSDAVRLEVADVCSEELVDFLLEKVELKACDVYRVNGPVNVHRLAALVDEIDEPSLKFPAFTPGRPSRFGAERDLFEAIRQRDVLMHHPYESFAPVIDLVRQAANDPAVLAIKQTLYRTGSDSLIVEALIDAARAGKEVTVVVELRARFDEAANIDLANKLQEAGVNVVYGIVGFKAHAKLIMIVRREGRELRRYVHLGTGNYHQGTARGYTDFGLLTDDPEVGKDVNKIFLQLTGLGRASKLRTLLQSPFTLHKTMLSLIDDEIEAARAGKPAWIKGKMNSLSEPRIIQALYKASRAGVQIDLVVRGICCLRPGVPGVSENIRVRSIVGRFLEHSRVYAFHHGGADKTFISSADWMSRNFFRRVETAAAIVDPDLRKRVLKESFDLALKDNTQAWDLHSDGSYHRVATQGRRRSLQAKLMESLGN